MDADRLRVEAYHVHTWFRDLVSYVGLSLLAVLGMAAPVGKFMKRHPLRFKRKKT